MSECCCKGIAADDPRFRQLDSFIQDGHNAKGSLIAVLHKAQQLFGFLPEEVQRHVAEALHLPPSEVYGVVTFYNYFTLKPVGKYPINVCMGTACYVRGGDRILSLFESELGLKPGEMTEDGLFSLEVCRCIGACGLAPVATIAGEVHGKLTEGEARKLLAALRQQADAELAAAEQAADSEPAAAAAPTGGEVQ